MRFIIAAFLGAASTANANTCGPFTTVNAGETYFAISQRCGVEVDQIFAANPNVDHNDLSVGQTLTLDPVRAVDGAQTYATQFVGTYANTSTCAGADIRIDLRPASIRFRNFNTGDGIDEDWECPIANALSSYPGAVTLTLDQCWAGYAALSWDDAIMTFEYAAAYEVQRCTDNED